MSAVSIYYLVAGLVVIGLQEMGAIPVLSEYGTNSMQRSVLTFRVFVCSTFSGLKTEQDVLIKDVFQRLREYCMKHGRRFQAVDLSFRLRPDRAAPRDRSGQGGFGQCCGRVPSQRLFRDTSILQMQSKNSCS